MSHTQQVVMWIEVTILWTVIMTVPGIAIALFPKKSWKTTYRPSWPGFLLIAAGWIPFGLPAMIAMLVGSLLLSPSKMPLPKRTRIFAGAAALVVGAAFSTVQVYREFTS